MSMMETSMKSNGKLAESEPYYRFMLVPERDLTLEVILPEDEETSVTPIVAHTDDLFESVAFTYDTESFVHRVGIQRRCNILRMDTYDINNYVLYYHDSFISTLKHYILGRQDSFTVSKIDLPKISSHLINVTLECYQCVMQTDYDITVPLPIFTVLLRYPEDTVAIRSIPGLDSIIWHMYPALFPRELFEKDEKVNETVMDWIADCSSLCDIFMAEIEQLFGMMSVQYGVRRMYAATPYEVEPPSYTVLSDHTASNYAMLQYQSGLVVYVVAQNAYCYSVDKKPERYYARVTQNPIQGIFENIRVKFGDDYHVRVYMYTGGICEATVELTGVDVFRSKLFESFYQN